MSRALIQTIKEEKLIAIIRGVEPKSCVKTVEALYDGGFRLAEITFDQRDPDSFERTAEAIAAVAKAFEGRMYIGAGTVTSTALVDLAAGAGAEFIVSPDTNPEVIRRTLELGLVSLPGALTPSEIALAHAGGADFVKLFPAGNLGVSYLKAVRAPLGHVNILAVGGINEKNLREFLAAGAVGAGIGGNLVNKNWVEAGEFYKITEAARAYVRIAKE